MLPYRGLLSGTGWLRHFISSSWDLSASSCGPLVHACGVTYATAREVHRSVDGHAGQRRQAPAAQPPTSGGQPRGRPSHGLGTGGGIESDRRRSGSSSGSSNSGPSGSGTNWRGSRVRGGGGSDISRRGSSSRRSSLGSSDGGSNGEPALDGGRRGGGWRPQAAGAEQQHNTWLDAEVDAGDAAAVHGEAHAPPRAPYAAAVGRRRPVLGIAAAAAGDEAATARTSSAAAADGQQGWRPADAAGAAQQGWGAAGAAADGRQGQAAAGAAADGRQRQAAAGAAADGRQGRAAAGAAADGRQGWKALGAGPPYEGVAADMEPNLLRHLLSTARSAQELHRLVEARGDQMTQVQLSAAMASLARLGSSSGGGRAREAAVLFAAGNAGPVAGMQQQGQAQQRQQQQARPSQQAQQAQQPSHPDQQPAHGLLTRDGQQQREQQQGQQQQQHQLPLLPQQQQPERSARVLHSVMESLTPRVLARLQLARPRDVAMAVYAASKVGFSEPALLQPLLARTQAQLRQMNGQDVTLLTASLTALSKLGCRPREELLHGLAEAAAQLAAAAPAAGVGGSDSGSGDGAFTPRAMVRTAAALTRLGAPAHLLLEAVAAPAGGSRGSGGRAAPPLLREGALASLQPHELCTLLWVCARQGFNEPVLLQRIGEATAGKLGALDSAGLRDFLWACSALSWQPGELLLEAAGAAAALLPRCAPADALQLLGGCERAGTLTPVLLDAAAGHYLAAGSGYAPGQLAWLLRCFEHAQHEHEPLAAAAMAAAADALPGMSAHEMAGVLGAVVALMPGGGGKAGGKASREARGGAAALAQAVGAWLPGAAPRVGCDALAAVMSSLGRWPPGGPMTRQLAAVGEALLAQVEAGGGQQRLGPRRVLGCCLAARRHGLGELAARFEAIAERQGVRALQSGVRDAAAGAAHAPLDAPGSSLARALG